MITTFHISSIIRKNYGVLFPSWSLQKNIDGSFFLMLFIIGICNRDHGDNNDNSNDNNNSNKSNNINNSSSNNNTDNNSMGSLMRS